MIEFYISTFRVTGLEHPRILLRGLIEPRVTKIAIECKGNKIIEYKLDQNGGFLNMFDIQEAILPCQYIKVWAYTDKYVLLKRLYVGLPVRMFQKGKTKNLKKEISTDKNECGARYLDSNESADYGKWIKQKKVQFAPVIQYEYNPLISIVIPVYNVEAIYLRECLESVLNQTYQNFEICIADDCSTNPETIAVLKEYEEKDKRIKIYYRKENGHISVATNSALAIAEGEFVGLLDNDDILVPEALNEVVAVLNKKREVDFIYSDEDKMNMNYEFEMPHFKQDFAKDSFLCCNYICHFSVIRRKLLQEVKGFRKGYEGAQDYDLFLRVMEKTDKIYHIPKILYHWRMIPGSTAAVADNKNYAGQAGQRALDDYLRRNNIEGIVNRVLPTLYSIRYPLKREYTVKIVLFSETEEGFEETIDNIMTISRYLNYSICVCGRIKQRKQLAFYRKYMKIDEVEPKKILEYLEKETAELLLFWDSQCRLYDPNWMKQILEYAVRPEQGAVGCKIVEASSDNHEVGIVCVEKEKAIPIRREYFMRFMIPVNYTLVNPNAFMVKREQFVMFQKEEKVEVKNIQNKMFQFQFWLLKQGYRNLILPTSVIKFAGKLQDEYFIEDNMNAIDMNADPHYNVNFSRTKAYWLDDINDEGEN